MITVVSHVQDARSFLLFNERSELSPRREKKKGETKLVLSRSKWFSAVDLYDARRTNVLEYLKNMRPPCAIISISRRELHHLVLSLEWQMARPKVAVQRVSISAV